MVTTTIFLHFIIVSYYSLCIMSTTSQEAIWPLSSALFWLNLVLPVTSIAGMDPTHL